MTIIPFCTNRHWRVGVHGNDLSWYWLNAILGFCGGHKHGHHKIVHPSDSDQRCSQLVGDGTHRREAYCDTAKVVEESAL